MLPGTQAAQICRKKEDIPSDLFPSNNRAGIESPISGPDTYHGQGFEINSIIDIVLSVIPLLRYRFP